MQNSLKISTNVMPFTDIFGLDTPNSSSQQFLHKLKTLKGLIKSNIEQLYSINEIDLRSTGRIIEEPNFEIGEEVIFTSYFISKDNPQKGLKNAEPNKYEYIKPWYESIKALGLNGIIFHDDLNEQFIHKYTTDKIRFLKCTLGEYSLNDERFIIMYLFLLKYSSHIKRMFLTDGRDVTVTANPFPFVQSKNPNMLFVGRNNGNRFRHSAYNYPKIKLFEKRLQSTIKKTFWAQPIYNAGITGGNLAVATYFYRAITAILLKCNSGENHNMIAINYAVHLYWVPKVVSGINKFKNNLFNFRIYNVYKNTFAKYHKKHLEHDNKNDTLAVSKYIFTSYPLCSAFKQFESKSKAYFIHK